MKKLVSITILGASLSVSAAVAQTSPKKGKGATKPVAVVLADAVSPPTTAVLPFEPVFWNSALPPKAYASNDAQKVYGWVEEKVRSIPGKPDEFSTKEEREQYGNKVSEVMRSIQPIAFPTTCVKKYDADRQIYEIKTPAFSIKDLMLKDPNPEALKLRKVRIGQRENVKEVYQAQNSYGAKTDVVKSVNDEFILAYPAGGENEPSALVVPGSTVTSLPYRYSFINYVAAVKMAPDEAREKQQDIGCIVVISLQAPYIFKYTERDFPTRDLPFDKTTNGFALYGKLDRLQVVNKASGEVYVQQARAGIL